MAAFALDFSVKHDSESEKGIVDFDRFRILMMGGGCSGAEGAVAGGQRLAVTEQTRENIVKKLD